MACSSILEERETAKTRIITGTMRWEFKLEWTFSLCPNPYIYLSKSRLSDPFFGLFLVISEVGSQIYIANLAIFKSWVFSATFWHEITLYAIDIDKKRFRTPFLTLYNHFENRPSTRLDYPQHLRMTHIKISNLGKIVWPRIWGEWPQGSRFQTPIYQIGYCCTKSSPSLTAVWVER